MPAWGLTRCVALAAYDFHVNVCANVAHKPPICADKPDAPGYQARPRRNAGAAWPFAQCSLAAARAGGCAQGG